MTTHPLQCRGLVVTFPDGPGRRTILDGLDLDLALDAGHAHEQDEHQYPATQPPLHYFPPPPHEPTLMHFPPPPQQQQQLQPDPTQAYGSAANGSFALEHGFGMTQSQPQHQPQQPTHAHAHAQGGFGFLKDESHDQHKDERKMPEQLRG